MPKRLDAGRLVMVPFAVLLTVGNVAAVIHEAGAVAGFDPAPLLRLAGGVLVVAFYALVVFVYLRRDTARSTSRSVPARLAAVVGSWLPLAFPYIPGNRPGAATLVLSNTLLIVGMTWSVVALRTLGRSFSVVPQARRVVSRGPYSVVRHPLYLGELVAAVGVLLRAPSVAGCMVWLSLAGLQAFRVRHEERVLFETLPDYADYRTATRWRIIPHVV